MQDFFLGGGGGGGRGDLTDDLRMYMRHCHAYILVNKSHNNAVITNVCNNIVLYTCTLLWNSGGGGGGNSSWGGGGDPSAPPPLSVCNPVRQKSLL